MDPFPRDGVPLPQGVFSLVSGACCDLLSHLVCRAAPGRASGKDSGIDAARAAIVPACSHKVAINVSIASR